MHKLVQFQFRHHAAEWARTHGREHCHAHQFWRVESEPTTKATPAFVVAIRSRNTGQLHHYATED